MHRDLTEDSYIKNIDKNETYSSEEKNFILERLNNERLLEQKAKEASSEPRKKYDKEDKDDILSKLNDERLRTQKREEMRRKRVENKQLYKFGQKEYYKFVNMERQYYMKKECIEKIGSRPSIVSLYYRTFGEMKKKDVLLKVESYSEKIYISYDAIRVYFKAYSFEDKR